MVDRYAEPSRQEALTWAKSRGSVDRGGGSATNALPTSGCRPGERAIMKGLLA
jgi:hypothetical protein